MALAPATVWNQRGRKMTAPKNPNAAKNIAVTDTEKFRTRNKLRGTIGIVAGSEHSAAQTAALALEPVARILHGKPPKRVIVVPDRIVNIVV